ncbi:MAG: type II secretion system protein N [Xanthomonadales bacterium]|nr:type II secretion system protein N [Xanthomonadales bacterium]
MRWPVVISGALLALLALFGALLVQLPASHALGWASRVVPELAVAGAAGTVWRGTASRVAWRHYELGRIEWVLDPLPLATGRVNADVSIVGAIEAQGKVTGSLGGGQIAMEAARCKAPAGWIQHILDAPFLQLEGTLEADIERVELRDGFLVHLAGLVRWDPAAVTGRIRTDLGGLEILWTTEGERIRGDISDTGGPLQAQGAVAIVDRQYDVNLALAARGDAESLRQALYVVGVPDAEGRVELNITGELVSIHE